MKVECCVSSKGQVTHIASQRVNGKLIIVEADCRTDAMAGLIHRVLELGVEKQAVDLLTARDPCKHADQLFKFEDFIAPVTL